MKTITNFKRPKPTVFTGFPAEIDTSKLKFVGYLQGERVDRCKFAGTDFFDVVHYLCSSENAKNGEPFIHAIVRMELTNSTRVAVFEE